MFSCEKCKTLEGEVAHLREQNSKLMDRLVALVDARAYGAIHTELMPSKEYFGGGDDEILEFNELGQEVARKPQA